ncbi:cilia- and flagella-associated protein 107 [Amia ocellicauda]|uniref:cilia- and flagella-associated protein 107 n=1 Tax=Amia ocellicauda TaxID=2972642 RepID=UPI0034640102
MAGAQSDPHKWKMPGWRIEQKYSNKVLLGNWVEERLQFNRQHQTASSSHRLDYRPHRDSRPDTIMRSAAIRRAEGLPQKLILSHHSPPHSHYLVSLYDEVYNRKGNCTLPPLRSWDGDKLAWVPERTDHPVQDPPTNFGLLQSRLSRWNRQEAPFRLQSVYRTSFPHHPSAAFSQPRFATARRQLSSHLHIHNRVNKDLDLKDRPCRQVPDSLPCVPLGGTAAQSTA